MTTFVKRTDVALVGAHTLPGRYFTSPEIFAEERAKIFLQRWLCVGREAQIARPGEYFLQQVGNESVIVLRDRSGQVRAYYNVCRHRGTRLCEEHRGQFSETIQCPYHAFAAAKTVSDRTGSPIGATVSMHRASGAAYTRAGLNSDSSGPSAAACC